MLNVVWYDTNSLEIGRAHVSGLTPGPELALRWLGDNNKKTIKWVEVVRATEEGGLVGPVSFSGDADRFVLLSAWCGGRQWFWIVMIFSVDRLSDEDAMKVVRATFAENGISHDEGIKEGE